MQKYPIGIQDFKKIREQNLLYVDKTEQIFHLLSGGSYYFLSRPRRFGKSLLLSTIASLYGGEKELFEGLWIIDRWDWERRFPIIHLRINSINYKKLGLEEALSLELDSLGAEYGLVYSDLELKDKFRKLLKDLALQQGKVVLLIDEYDKPILDYLGDFEKMEEHRAILKQFYSIIKDSDPFIKFFILTGVSRFSKVSIFSDLNNISDISVLPNYNNLVGISEREVERYFQDRIKEIAQKQDKSYEALKTEIKEWYNGYNFSGEERMYNPFSLLSFMRDGVFNNYWFSTGTPTFLVELIRNHGQYVLDDNAFVSLLTLGDFDAANMDYTSVLFQTGYLTLKEIHFEEGWCRLQYPNREVQASLEQLLLGAYRYGQPSSGLPLVLQMRQALQSKDVEEVISIINSVFSTIPYDLWRGASELHYHALVHLTFSLLGNYVQSEVHSSRGRCDAVVQTKHQVYAFEFKLDKSVAEAMAQLEERGYLNPYQHTDKELIGIGINFSSEAKQVEGWEMKVYGL